ncbi:hypothetical protein BJV77DRAFT_1065856 [Russula vinacea]|nr:hypothetical protein BJV77DRAFT_1065856 [Russula vinacea]
MRLNQIHRFPELLLSTVHRGTAFEYRALALLTKHMSMSLMRVGGSYDGGVDLTGWWWVPSESRTTPYGLQHSKPAPPAHPRPMQSRKEEDGPRLPARARGRRIQIYVPTSPTPPEAKAKQQEKEPPPVALLVSESAFTRNCLLAAHASPLPFLLVHLPPQPLPSNSNSNSGGSSSSSSAIGAVFGNPALVSAKGVLGGELEIRWERGAAVPPSGVLCGGGSGRPRLWWQGQPLASWTPDADVDADGVVLDQR